VYATAPHARIVWRPVPALWRAELVLFRRGVWGTRPVRIRHALRDAGLRPLARGSVNLPAARSRATLELRPPDLQPGPYRWTFTLFGQNRRRIARREVRFRIVSQPPRVYIDAKRRLRAGGTPFFPLGLYMAGHDTEQDLARIAAAGFNTLLSYTWGAFGHTAAQGLGPGPRAFLDRAGAHGLRVIYALQDFFEESPTWLCRTPGACVPGTTGLDLVREYVLALRDHPALLAWYLNDERPSAFVPQLRERIELIDELDPEHPCLQVLALDADATQAQQALALDAYYDNTDLLGVDPYPVAGAPPLKRPMKMVGAWTDSAKISARDVRPVWNVVQTHPWGNYTGNPADRAPSLEEQRCMAYLALVHGADGLLLYSYFDLFHPPGRPDDPVYFESRWAEVAAIGQELSALAPELLRGRDLELASSGPASPLQARALEEADGLHLLLANPNRTRPAGRTFTLPPGHRGVPVPLSGPIQARRRGSALEVTLPPLGSGRLLVRSASA
jgi:hypothetical protein